MGDTDDPLPLLSSHTTQKMNTRIHQEYLLQTDEEQKHDSAASNSYSLTILASSSYQHLPSDLIYLIASLLDGRSLARFSACDQTTKKVIETRQQELWRRLTGTTTAAANMTPIKPVTPCKWEAEWITPYIKGQIDWALDQQGFERYQPSFNPRKYYAARYLETAKHLRLLKAQYELEKKRLEGGGKKREVWMKWLEEVCVPVMIVVLIVIWIAVMIWELQTSDDGTVTYRSLWPILVILSFTFISFLNLLYLRWRNSVYLLSRSSSSSTRSIDPIRSALYIDATPGGRFLPDSYWRESRSHVIWLMRNIEGSDDTGGMTRDTAMRNQRDVLRLHLVILMIFIGLASWIVLITLKATNTISSSWSSIFLPFYLSSFIYILSCFTLSCFAQSSAWLRNRWMRGVRPAGVVIPLVFQMMLLHLYLLGSISRLQTTLIPFTLLHTCLILRVFYLICCARNSSQNGYSLPVWLIALPAYIAIPAPFFLFQLFLSLKVDGDWKEITWVGVFSPLFFTMFLLFSITSMQSWDRNTVLWREFDSAKYSSNVGLEGPARGRMQQMQSPEEYEMPVI